MDDILIRCAKRGCKWRGHESDLNRIPHAKWEGAEQLVCPTCASESYYRMNEKEIAAWHPAHPPETSENEN